MCFLNEHISELYRQLTHELLRILKAIRYRAVLDVSLDSVHKVYIQVVFSVELLQNSEFVLNYLVLSVHAINDLDKTSQQLRGKHHSKDDPKAGDKHLYYISTIGVWGPESNS